MREPSRNEPFFRFMLKDGSFRFSESKSYFLKSPYRIKESPVNGARDWFSFGTPKK
jgi:hypothetical protein